MAPEGASPDSGIISTTIASNSCNPDISCFVKFYLDAFALSVRQFAKIYIDCGDPLGWFEALYLAADENPNVIPWVALKVTLTENGKTRPLGFTAQVSPRNEEKSIILEYFNCTQGEGISLEVVVALMQKVKELVKLPDFKYEEIVLQIRKMKIQKQMMRLLVDARLNQLPSL